MSFIWESYGAWVRLGTFIQYFGYILWRWEAPWTTYCWVSSEKVMVTWVKFSTLTNLLVTFCGRWEAPWTMGWWVSSEKVMVTWVRLGTFTQSFGYILWKVRSTMNHFLLSFIWKSYGDLSKVRYFYPIFWLYSVEGEKHHELKWWVSSEKVMVTWVRLGTFTQSFGYIL